MKNLYERIWRWVEREHWKQVRATRTLHNAHDYLWEQYWAKASSRDRDWILPEVEEALQILTTAARKSIEAAYL